MTSIWDQDLYDGKYSKYNIINKFNSGCWSCNHGNNNVSFEGVIMKTKEIREKLETINININNLLKNIAILQGNGLLQNINYSNLNQKISELKGLQSIIADEVHKHL